MTGKVNMQRSEIKEGRCKILFHLILRTSFIFYSRDERAVIRGWNLETFSLRHKGKCQLLIVNCQLLIR